MMTTTHLCEENHDENQPRYPCPTCKFDCENENCILCDYCHNWFHKKCAKLSDKRFDLLSRSTCSKYKCKY